MSISESVTREPSTDPQSSIPIREERFTTSDGTTLAVWVSGADDADITLFLLHGWTLDHRTWDDVRARLIEANPTLRVVAYDHRGHGGSDPARDGTATIEQLAQDLRELIDAFAPGGALVLAGHSMGGMTIMEFGASYPELVNDRVQGVGFVATSAGPFFRRLRKYDAFGAWWSGTLHRMEASATRPQSESAARFGAKLSMFGRGAKLHDVDRAVAQGVSASPGTRHGFGISLFEHDRSSALRAFNSVPAVVLGGTRDRQTPLRHALILADTLPQASLTVLPDAGHMLPYERTRVVSGRLQSLLDGVRSHPAAGTAYDEIDLGGDVAREESDEAGARVLRSPFADVEIPDLSLYEYLFGGLSGEDLDRTALIDPVGKSSSTYRELLDQVDAVAGALAALGVEAGDVVGILSPNIPAFATFFHAVLRAGATATTINALFTAGEIAKQLRDSNATVLVTVSALVPQAGEAIREVGLTDEKLIVIDGEGVAKTGHQNLPDLLEAALPAPDVSFDPASHVAVLPYSSGTTGKPKGVKLTHANLVANVAQIRPLQGIVADDVILAVLPFFHIYGMTVLLNAALLGRASLVVMPKFDLQQFLGNIQEYKISYAFIAPPVAVALAKHPIVDEYDTSSLHTILSGAAPLDQELGEAVAERIGARVLQGYGMSELSPVSHLIPFDGGSAVSGKNAPLSSVGWAVPNSENRIVDPQSGDTITIPEVGRSEPGELWVKGPNVMLGYLNNDAATADTLDADGFLHTGDLAQIDSNGCVYIVDRLKELIKYKGYQVPPAELEALLLTNPKVADAAVIGVVDKESGEEIPKAYIVKQPKTKLTAKEVVEFVADRVAPHKKVRAVEFIDTIPKSASGKILRRELRDPIG